MLIDQDEVNKRLNNPLNLMNRMREGISPLKRNGMALFMPSNEVKKEKERNSDPVKTTFNPFEKKETALVPATKTTPLSIVSQQTRSESLSSTTVTTNDVIDDSDSKIKLALAHDNALDLLTASIGKLKGKIDNDEIKASSIPSVIASASKVITEIRKERLEREKNSGKDANVHYHFYCPEPKKIEEYDVIEVNG